MPPKFRRGACAPCSRQGQPGFGHLAEDGTETDERGAGPASLRSYAAARQLLLGQQGLPQWDWSDPRSAELIATADDVAKWARDTKNGLCGQNGQAEGQTPSTQSTPSISYPEIVANGALALITVACSLLDRPRDVLSNRHSTEQTRLRRLPRLPRSSRKKAGLRSGFTEAGKTARMRQSVIPEGNR